MKPVLLGFLGAAIFSVFSSSPMIILTILYVVINIILALYFIYEELKSGLFEFNSFVIPIIVLFFGMPMTLLGAFISFIDESFDEYLYDIKQIFSMKWLKEMKLRFPLYIVEVEDEIAKE